jgi:hypothetical protein
MNDLDTNTLRRALRASQEPRFPAAADGEPGGIAEIIARGRRLRWRRRAAAAGGSLCLAAAVVGAVTGIGRLTAPSPGPGQHVVSPVGPTRTVPVTIPSPGRLHDTPKPVPSVTAAATAPPTPTSLPTATETPKPTPTRSVAPTPTSSRTAGATPNASAPSTDTGQPSATPSARTG